MAPAVEAHPDLSFRGDFGPIPFDEGGTLDQERLFPSSVRGRRKSGSAYAHAH